MYLIIKKFLIIKYGKSNLIRLAVLKEKIMFVSHHCEFISVSILQALRLIILCSYY